MSLNNEPCMVRPVLIDVNLVELNVCNVTVFNVIRNKSEAKTMVKQFM